MAFEGKSTSAKVVFLFTTFPVPSETFLQREATVFQRSGMDFQIVSLWGGNTSWNGIEIEKEGLLTALAGILWIPYYLAIRPSVFWKFLKAVWLPRSSGILNWGENLLGAGYALRTARRWKHEQVTHFHGVWASAPAMAAWFLSELTNIPFSFAGHAYDLFENGGDGWISGKIAAAEWIRTSTNAGKCRLVELGAPEQKVQVARRGLVEMPPPLKDKVFSPPYRFLSVGRMVEKMGFDRQIPLIQELIRKGLPLRVDWIGHGPERKSLENKVKQAGLEAVISIHGYLPYKQVEAAYRKADCFLFTGRVASSGDRAGLPNVVAEAMAWGVLVFSTRVGAVEEAVENGESGILWDTDPDAMIVLEILNKPHLVEKCRLGARRWIEKKFDLGRNLDPLRERLSL